MKNSYEVIAPSPVIQATQRGWRTTTRSQEQLAAYALLLPSLIAFITFAAIPAIMGLGLSLFRWNLLSPPQFAGLENWATLLNHTAALASIRTTVLLVALTVPLGIVVGLALALLLNKLPWGRAIFRTIFFAPVVTSLIAISFVWRNMYDTQTGLINYLLGVIGIRPVPWLTDPNVAVLSVVLLLVWQSAGFKMLIFLAGLQSIDESLYEAATVDGARRWKTFWTITLPLLSPTMFFVAVTSIITGFQTFEAVYVLTQGGPGYATTTLVYFIVQAAFRSFDMGLAAAMSLVLFGFIFVVTLVQWHFQDRWVHYG